MIRVLRKDGIMCPILSWSKMLSGSLITVDARLPFASGMGAFSAFSPALFVVKAQSTSLVLEYVQITFLEYGGKYTDIPASCSSFTGMRLCLK